MLSYSNGPECNQSAHLAAHDRLGMRVILDTVRFVLLVLVRHHNRLVQHGSRYIGVLRPLPHRSSAVARSRDQVLGCGPHGVHGCPMAWHHVKAQPLRAPRTHAAILAASQDAAAGSKRLQHTPDMYIAHTVHTYSNEKGIQAAWLVPHTCL